MTERVPDTGVMWPRRRLLKAGSVVAISQLACPLAQAELGKKGARLVVGFVAGGAGDNLARTLALDLQALYPAGLIVDNRPGASGRLAIDALRVADPDGNTLLYSPSALLTITPHAVKAGNFKPLDALKPIAAVSRQDFALVVSGKSKLTNVAELVEKAKEDSSFATYGTAGAGTPQHLIGHLLAKATGAPLVHAPYKGGAAALQDTLAGHTPICIAAVSQQLLGFAADGRLRILAVSGQKRSSFLPSVPTFIQQGFASICVEDWSGVLAPAKTPAEVVTKLAKRLSEITGSTLYADALAKSGQEVLSDGPAAYTERLRNESARWAPIVKDAGFSLDS
ncbi:Bug family tripartite tricarboxylate transporter substrate binding protein [Comamonas thiooxydans]|nr:tripartite tricarboxylate transporter substrate binding protein [Comamonas thiooxydans]